MNRRDFFKKSSLAISTIAIAGGAAGSLNKLLAKNKTNEHFSFEIITDKPVKAIKLAEEFFRASSLDDKIIKFSQYPVEGELFGDLAFVHKGKLLNYKSGTGNINSNLKDIAKSLDLPKKVTNPTRIKFYTADENSAAERFLVFHKGNLVKTITPDGDTFNINVQGSKGNVMINFENNKARVVQSACTHKTCINSGSITLSGESIVCIPNEVLIVGE
jgi:hypothetical protein